MTHDFLFQNSHGDICLCWRAQLIFISYRSAQLIFINSQMLTRRSFHSPHPHGEFALSLLETDDLSPTVIGSPQRCVCTFSDSCSRLILRRSPWSSLSPRRSAEQQTSELLSGAADPAGYLTTLRPHPRGWRRASRERDPRADGRVDLPLWTHVCRDSVCAGC